MPKRRSHLGANIHACHAPNYRVARRVSCLECVAVNETHGCSVRRKLLQMLIASVFLGIQLRVAVCHESEPVVQMRVPAKRCTVLDSPHTNGSHNFSKSQRVAGCSDVSAKQPATLKKMLGRCY